MPFAEDELITNLENRLKDFSSITSLLDQGFTPEDMMHKLFEGYDITFNEPVVPTYFCNCSKDRVHRAVMSIGREEIQKMIDDKEPIEVNCQFCNRHYTFDISELKEMIS
jgi:molecular chaperone Hsp33